MGREEKYSWGHEELGYSQCVDCKHARVGSFCDAFLQEEGVEIPMEILTNEHEHKRPWPGDHGIRFERG